MVLHAFMCSSCNIRSISRMFANSSIDLQSKFHLRVRSAHQCAFNARGKSSLGEVIPVSFQSEDHFLRVIVTANSNSRIVRSSFFVDFDQTFVASPFSCHHTLEYVLFNWALALFCIQIGGNLVQIFQFATCPTVSL